MYRAYGSCCVGEKKLNNPLYIAVEKYDILPIDKKTFLGKYPNSKKIIPYEPFEFYIERKLYMHNMGHAICAYLGMLLGIRYISGAIKKPIIRLIVMGAMEESVRMLAKKYKYDYDILYLHMMDLIYRFQNPELKDSLVRIGRDPLRKLQPNDRLVGALNECLKMNIEPINICAGIAAAILFHIKEMKYENSEKQCKYILEAVCKINLQSKYAQYILTFYSLLLNKDKVDKILETIDCFYKERIGNII